MASPAPSTSPALPPVMRRGVWGMLGLSVFFVLAAIAWMVLRWPLGVPRGFVYRYGALLLVAVPFVIIRPLWLRRTRQIRRALVESGGRLCTHCAYDVSTLAPSGTCPECGRPYDVEQDRGLWHAVEEFADAVDGQVAPRRGDDVAKPST